MTSDGSEEELRVITEVSDTTVAIISTEETPRTPSTAELIKPYLLVTEPVISKLRNRHCIRKGYNNIWLT